MTREIGKPPGSGCQIALVATAVVAAVLWGLLQWEAYRHRHPTENNARQTIERLAEISLPEDTAFLVAQRSGSSFFGDHSACFLIGLPDEEFDTVVDQIPQVDGTRIENGCPVHDAELDGFAWTLWSAQDLPDGEIVYIFLDREESQILLMYFLT
tara:strand:- start:26325 stop:26789 length:465 start_codon:yes stop_codon:yes gene_type:complete